jgi:hypothetical protein
MRRTGTVLELAVEEEALLDSFRDNHDGIVMAIGRVFGGGRACSKKESGV